MSTDNNTEITKNSKLLRTIPHSEKTKRPQTKSERTSTVVKNIVNAKAVSSNLGETVEKACKLINGHSQRTTDWKKTDETNDDNSVARKDEVTEETMTGENYLQLLQKRLMKECQSYLNDDNSTISTTSLDVNVTVMLEKRILNAIQVINLVKTLLGIKELITLNSVIVYKTKFILHILLFVNYCRVNFFLLFEKPVEWCKK